MSSRGKMRNKLKKKTKGDFKPNAFLKKYDVGEKVKIEIEPASHKGMPHPRFDQRVGNVVEKRGSCYVVVLKEGNKEKKLLCGPEHLSKLGDV